MINKLPKLPKQLSFSFMSDQASEKKASLSKEEQSELIQALADLILACTKVSDPIKAEEILDDER